MAFDIEAAIAAARQSTSSGAYTSQGSSSTQKEPMVWMGTLGPGRVVDETAGGVFRPDGGITATGIPVHGTVATKKNQDDARTVDQAYTQFYAWNDAQRKTWMDLLQSQGLVEPGDYSWDHAKAWWEKAVDESAKMFAAGKKIAPQQWLKWYANGQGKNGSGPGRAAGTDTGPRKTTSTSKTIPYEDPAALRAFIKEGVHSILGRKIEDDELDDMMHIARQYTSPTVTQSTTTADSKGNTSTVNKTIKPGTSEAARAEAIESAIKDKPEYASYQAAGTMMNWLLGAIGPGGA